MTDRAASHFDPVRDADDFQVAEGQRQLAAEENSADTTHRCPGPDCERRVPLEQLACQNHWFQVPRPLRSEVWSAWRALQHARPEDAGDAIERHGRAMDAAIATMRSVA